MRMDLLRPVETPNSERDRTGCEHNQLEQREGVAQNGCKPHRALLGGAYALNRLLVVARRMETAKPNQTQRAPRSRLTAYQRYACQKFGLACPVALAIQRSENPTDMRDLSLQPGRHARLGYFQINTIHLKTRRVRLRDLLDCKTNIDFSYQLHGFLRE
jgi:hypothetical protein